MWKFIFTAACILPVQLCHAQLQVLTLSKADANKLVQAFDTSGFSGSILMVQGHKTILEYNRGYADFALQKPNTGHTRYNAGSAGKCLTAILIMQLAEQEKIALDQPFGKYLPATRIPQANRVTIRQLLNMTAGLGDFFDHPGYDESRGYMNADIYRLIDNAQTTIDTSAGIHYSNTAYIILGEILETAYKKTYQQIVAEQIFKPAHIKPAGKSNAIGYLNDTAYTIAATDNLPQYWSAAGGIYLSVHELHRIVQAFVKGKYVSQKSIAQLWHKEVHPERDPPFVHYGLGWMMEEPGGVKLRGHNGGVQGFQSAFRYLPDDEVYIYILANKGEGAESSFMQILVYILGKKGVSL